MPAGTTEELPTYWERFEYIQTEGFPTLLQRLRTRYPDEAIETW